MRPFSGTRRLGIEMWFVKQGGSSFGSLQPFTEGLPKRFCLSRLFAEAVQGGHVANVVVAGMPSSRQEEPFVFVLPHNASFCYL